jgi:hypothetical protein
LALCQLRFSLSLSQLWCSFISPHSKKQRFQVERWSGGRTVSATCPSKRAPGGRDVPVLQESCTVPTPRAGRMAHFLQHLMSQGIRPIHIDECWPCCLSPLKSSALSTVCPWNSWKVTSLGPCSAPQGKFFMPLILEGT